MILLDTHALVWALMQPELLSVPARDRIAAAPAWAISSASLYETRYKHRLGKWPAVARLAEPGALADLERLGIAVLAADGTIMDLAGGLERDHRDPFDRIILATAMLRDLPIVSKDATLDTGPAEAVVRVW